MADYEAFPSEYSTKELTWMEPMSNYMVDTKTVITGPVVRIADEKNTTMVLDVTQNPNINRKERLDSALMLLGKEASTANGIDLINSLNVVTALGWFFKESKEEGSEPWKQYGVTSVHIKGLMRWRKTLKMLKSRWETQCWIYTIDTVAKAEELIKDTKALRTDVEQAFLALKHALETTGVKECEDKVEARVMKNLEPELAVLKDRAEKIEQSVALKPSKDDMQSRMMDFYYNYMKAPERGRVPTREDFLSTTDPKRSASRIMNVESTSGGPAILNNVGMNAPPFKPQISTLTLSIPSNSTNVTHTGSTNSTPSGSVSSIFGGSAGSSVFSNFGPVTPMNNTQFNSINPLFNNTPVPKKSQIPNYPSQSLKNQFNNNNGHAGSKPGWKNK